MQPDIKTNAILQDCCKIHSKYIKCMKGALLSVQNNDLDEKRKNQNTNACISPGNVHCYSKSGITGLKKDNQ